MQVTMQSFEHAAGRANRSGFRNLLKRFLVGKARKKTPLVGATPEPPELTMEGFMLGYFATLEPSKVNRS